VAFGEVNPVLLEDNNVPAPESVIRLAQNQRHVPVGGNGAGGSRGARIVLF
jgi:hypothetical protein